MLHSAQISIPAESLVYRISAFAAGPGVELKAAVRHCTHQRIADTQVSVIIPKA
jgi:hypothetical protein